VELLNHFKISKTAQTYEYFGLRRNRHQGATVST